MTAREIVYATASSPDGQLLASVGERGSIRLWDLKTGEIRFQELEQMEMSHAVRAA